jgi:hypothetical protein
MNKPCSVCHRLVQDGDPIIAIVRSTYKALGSKISFAITKPQACLSVTHEYCYEGAEDVRED